MNKFLTLLAAVILPMCLITPSRADVVGADAKAPIEALNNALLAAMRAGKSTPFTERYAMLAPAVEHAFDLDTVLETSVGPKWQSFTPAQQQSLKEAFLRFTVASYVANFSSYSGERFETSPDGRMIGNDQVVETKILPRPRAPAHDAYVVGQGGRAGGAGARRLDGSISRVAVQRSDFRRLSENGPDPLIESLQNKTNGLSGSSGVQ